MEESTADITSGSFVTLQKEGHVECIALGDTVFCTVCSIWLFSLPNV